MPIRKGLGNPAFLLRRHHNHRKTRFRNHLFATSCQTPDNWPPRRALETLAKMGGGLIGRGRADHRAELS